LRLKVIKRRRRPSNYQVITFTMGLLRAGIPASELPDRLMVEFGLRPDQTRYIIEQALELHQKPSKRGKLDTKPLE
jgi:hypothetical protein